MGRPKNGYVGPNGESIPGVTTILGRSKPAGALIHWAWKLGLDGVDYRAARDTAAGIGSDVHDRIDRFLRMGIDSASVLPDESERTKSDLAYAAWHRWWSERGLWMESTEEALISPELGYAGTYDGLAHDADGRLVLLDWKTSRGIYPEATSQCAAYASLLWECKRVLVSRVEIINATKEGEVSHLGYDLPRDMSEHAPWRAFQAALSLYKEDEHLKALVKGVERIGA